MYRSAASRGSAPGNACASAGSPVRSCRQLGAARLPQHQRRVAARATPEEDLDQQLQADLERMRQRQAAAGGSGSGGPGAAPAAARAQQQAAGGGGSAEAGGPLSGVKEAVDKLLIADFFFILFALAWLGVALGARSAFQSTALLDAWLGLWQWVFQPAIGVLMLGALVSGGVGWAKENLGGK